MAKNSFILYHDQKEIIDELTDEQAGKLFKAIYEYNVNKSVKLDGTLKIIFIPFKTSFDRDSKKYKDIVDKRSEAGKKHTGNQHTRKKELEQMEQVFQIGTNGTDSVSVSVSDSVNDNVSDSVSVSVINNTHTHTLDDIFAYAKEIGIEDKEYCKKFFNNYESVGWVTNTGRKIVNWKTKFNQWVKNDGILEHKEETKKNYL